jgi:DNA (cytosine-5)-methyltransferase 1
MSEKIFKVADLFCGAGGSSTGARKAIESIGGTMELVAVNHWPVAVETHSLNHPNARHYVQNLETADPETIVPEGYLDLLMASPECRFFSRARGGKPTKEQGRVSAWFINNWLTSLDVRVLLVENVPEFVNWGPLLLPSRKPDPARRGMFFEEWVRSLWGLGYQVEWRNINAADHGDATSRTRFFLQARNDGNPIAWPEATHSRHGGARLEGKVKQWRGAREIIDWSNPGQSLLDAPKYRKKPLAVKTRRRMVFSTRAGNQIKPSFR